MYEISVRQHFDAAHALRGYQGKCENLHGHRYEVVVGVEAAQLNDIGLACDFVELKRYLGDILSHFDHTNLNETPPFDELNPSAENIATTIYSRLQPLLSGVPVRISSIEVWESPENHVIYRP
jgi:6-pyruvoyltetrahydropterin/6-carboxytetrahydropterin synthase